MKNVGIAAVGVLVAVGTMLGSAVVTYKHMQKAGAKPLPSYKNGDKVQALPGLDYSDYELSVLMMMPTGCSSCEDAVGVYKASTRAIGDGARIRLIWVSAADPVDTARFVAAKGLPSGRVVQINPAILRLSALPSLMAVDRTGAVRARWVGRKAMESQGTVADALRQLADDLARAHPRAEGVR